jgi:hypothetical protein
MSYSLNDFATWMHHGLTSLYLNPELLEEASRIPAAPMCDLFGPFISSACTGESGNSPDSTWFHV